MKVSHNWLQTYFDKPLPKAEELADLITFHAFEIEGVEEKQDDSVIDVDVLSNRSSDCLSHRGIARELATLLERGKEFQAHDPLATSTPSVAESKKVSIRIDAESLVNRFSVAYLEGVTIGPSPQWLKERLSAIGQKSINNVVDATNYVMFALGQPLHAFDADKFAGEIKSIAVRTAKNGEKITTLTNDTYELDDSTLLIVDGADDTPLGIAGIKGGKHAEVDANTKNIIIEAANFNYVSVRRTSQKLKLQTDASVRFQNQPVPELTSFALRDVVAVILEIAGGTHEGGADWYPKPRHVTPVRVSQEDINTTLGTQLDQETVRAILDRFNWKHAKEDDAVIVEPEFARSDINIPEDLIEEIGRVHGYAKIEAQKLPTFDKSIEINKRFFYTEKIRRVLANSGFFEVYTYTLCNTGEVELANALATDKNFMRADLASGLRESLKKNLYNAPLLGLEQVKIFELGPVWKGDKEILTLGLAVGFTRKFKGETADNIVRAASETLARELGAAVDVQPESGVAEIDIDMLIEKLSEPEEYDPALSKSKDTKYAPLSPYPFVLRDIAVWVPEDTPVEELNEIFTRESGNLLARQPDFFDEFSKEGKISYAFHLVFQSHEKTLSDDEINAIMERITVRILDRGFEVR